MVKNYLVVNKKILQYVKCAGQNYRQRCSNFVRHVKCEDTVVKLDFGLQ